VTTTVLFDREIVGILNRHCVMCHTENGPSFALETYEQTWLQRRKISAAVLAHRMPPWPAVSGYGRFANENVVTLRESQFLVSWMEGLGPRNAGRVFTNTSRPDSPAQQAVRAHIDLDAWPLGQPELVRDLPPVTVESARPTGVQRTIVDLGLTDERWVRAFEYLPGDRRVVRAAFFSVQETGQWIGSWTPWSGFMKLPQRTAYRLPAGAHLVAEIHYQQGSERLVGRGKVGFFFESTRPANVVSDLVIDAMRDAASNSGSQRFHAQTSFADGATLLALRPEVEAGVTSVEVSARRPDGGTDVLLFAKDIPVDWPTPYVLAEPVAVRRGTTLSVTAYRSSGGNVPAPASVRVRVSFTKSSF
jgi:hypothetical protein